MKFSKLIAVITITLSAFSIISCDDDIDINAPYKDVAVVYCLLDEDTNKQYIRINKLYQTEGNAVDDAKDRSIHEYSDELTGRLIELDASGNEIQSFNLQSEVITNKDSGLFYYPEQKVYFVEGELNPKLEYQLLITKPNGEEVSGKTALLEKANSSLEVSRQWTRDGIPLMGIDGVKETVDFDVNSPVNGKSFEVSMSFNYEEVYDNGTSTIKSIAFPLGSYDFKGIRDENGPIITQRVAFSPLSFYERISSEVPLLTGNESPGILKRIPLDFSTDVYLNFADRELDIYNEVSEPSTSLLEDKPAYTNVVNGIGIIASRTTDLTSYALSALSYKELVSGEKLGLTGGRGFCDPNAPIGDSDSCF